MSRNCMPRSTPAQLNARTTASVEATAPLRFPPRAGWKYPAVARAQEDGPSVPARSMAGPTTAQMQIGLEVQGRRIQGNVVSKATRTSQARSRLRALPIVQGCVRNFPGYGCPYTPHKTIFQADDGNFETATNEDVLAIDHADIAVKPGAAFALRFRNAKPVIGRLAGKVERQGIELFSATSAGPGMVHEALPGSATQRNEIIASV